MNTDNATLTVDSKGVMTLKVNLEGESFLSKGGKMDLLATSSGFAPIYTTSTGRRVKISYNVGI